MYDVLIIGAGITGATIARELSKYSAKTLIVERETDVCMGASMANSAIVHSGHDPKPGSNKAKFNVLGNKMYKQMSDELDIPLLECGALVVATSEEEMATIKELYERSKVNGVESASLISKEEAKKREPNLSSNILGALDLPTTGVTFPFEGVIANVENAMDNGVELEVNQEVVSIDKKDGYYVVKTKTDMFETRQIVNCAGIFADDIYRMVSDNIDFEINARKGSYLLLDKDTKGYVNSVIYPTPSSKGKGVIVTPQTHGNTLLGPSSDFVDKSEQHTTTREGIDYVRTNLAVRMDNVPLHKVIRSFAGSRATSTTNDFVIEEAKDSEGFINVAGIESPGLTAAPAIAKYVVEEIIQPKSNFEKNEEFNPIRRKVNRVVDMSPKERKEIVARDSRYANIICRCEQISEGEIIESIHRNCGGRTVSGIKMRVRPGAGRCQGGFCQSEVLRILSEELEIDKTEVLYNTKNSNILLGKIGEIDE